jgi:hypothetical protein
MNTTWDEIVAEGDLIGGRIWTFENGEIYRCTINGVSCGFEDAISFKVSRLELCTDGNNKWATPLNAHPTSIGGPLDACQPKVADEGHISFDIPYMGTAVVVPLGVSEPKDALDFLDNFI